MCVVLNYYTFLITELYTTKKKKMHYDNLKI